MRFYPLLFCCLASMASAAPASLKRVMDDVKGISVQHSRPDLHTMMFYPAGRSPLRVYGYVVPVKPVGQSISFRLRTGRLYQTERQILNEMIGRVATQCFNLKAERKQQIGNWLSAQNVANKSFSHKSFGPVEVVFERRALQDKVVWTTIQLIRRQAVGQGPWVNYCR